MLKIKMYREDDPPIATVSVTRNVPKDQRDSSMTSADADCCRGASALYCPACATNLVFMTWTEKATRLPGTGVLATVAGHVARRFE